jgi:DNA polymerase-3 subunit gamma/tau
MSYQVLARKWRPRFFREMVGQEHVLKALINALDHGRLHHAYLFTGTRGVGKTTIARILAKCLNCETGISSEPCGQCTSCVEISEGRFIDLIEVDAASRTKVEDTRELLENVQYAPTRGRFKVYLIDEVHMLSTHSFNALLKTLEEPPPHVKFLLATTDPQKLPATILSRCLQFNLKNMTPERIVGHLKHILEQELVQFEEPALWLLGRSADGSMRDALSLTDQAIAFGSGKVAETDVRTMLGTIDRPMIFNMVAALSQQDGKAVLQAVADLSEHAPDYHAALAELLSVLHRIAVAQTVPDALDNSFGDEQRVRELAALLTAEEVQLYYQLGVMGRRDLQYAADARAALEMTLLRMLAFRPQGVPEPPTRSLRASTAGEAVDTAKKSFEPAPPAAVGAAPAPNVAPPVAVAVAAKPVSTPASTRAETAAIPVSTAAPIRPAASAQLVGASQQSTAVQSRGSANGNAARAVVPEATAAVVSQRAPLQVTLLELTPASWCDVAEALTLTGVARNIVINCALVAVKPELLTLALDEAQATLFNDAARERIAQALSDYFETRMKVDINVAALPSETAAQRRMRLREQALQKARADIEADPNVQLLMSQFAASIDYQSIAPVEVK